MKMTKIQHSLIDEVRTITIDNPDKRNAFDGEMSDAVTELIKTAEPQGARIVVITANLSNGIFSAGHDLNELKSASDLSHDPMFSMFDAIQDCPLPVVAKVSGRVFAGAILAEKFPELKIYYKLAMQPMAGTLLKPEVAQKAWLNTFFLTGVERGLIKGGINQDQKHINYITHGR